MPNEHKRAQKIFKTLQQRYPDAHCALDYNSPLELLFATILSAQSTDVGVNKATPELFKAFPTVQDYASASPEKIEPYISSIGLFRGKAKSIYTSANMIVDDFGGEVPDNMKDLVKLRGVARKTANVVLGNAFHKNEGVVVDTHVGRLAHRFGLTKETKPDKIEKDLMALFPQEEWTTLSHLLVWHGRQVCKKRGGTCSEDSICKKFCSNASV
jgi:endonuclease-3|tara:strand:- start:296 stop:934 length:639 start_codon:yes stop_codon:yes gene_type:complete